jgi:hypothetical protein
MIIVAVLSTLAGAVLGFWLRVVILVPASGLALVAGYGCAPSDHAGTTILAMTLAVIGLQMGYLAGAVTRFVIGWSFRSGGGWFGKRVPIDSPTNLVAILCSVGQH